MKPNIRTNFCPDCKALQADNARLREEIARLRGPVTTYKKGYGVGDGDAALQETER